MIKSKIEKKVTQELSHNEFGVLIRKLGGTRNTTLQDALTSYSGEEPDMIALQVALRVAQEEFLTAYRYEDLRTPIRVLHKQLEGHPLESILKQCRRSTCKVPSEKAFELLFKLAPDWAQVEMVRAYLK